ncbi:hypothetical protein GCM10010329_16060 [Streptomyces spiroverticillatus]|uniref:DUF397 domain-containing protein n=1 Tax=Streptomyces finlayi TaxID=67296 RepID=A0A918X389_9ACTN|nr:DUF397 domain-containing protein [Streptomyces finlayi]GGZ95211.1 hypothetical protein GCM10010329_16060 [Streptomyces spiroverticillatus]GHD07492.1 hypothetical protein GCM10010334_60090 [Streptomyces finlayi]
MPELHFRKSSYSDAHDECVEVALNVPATVAVRDSKDPNSPLVLLAPTAWQAFAESLKQ